MLLKKRVRAGILLYALLMLAIFSLLLQFYLNRQLAESQLVQASKQEATAYIIAQLVLEQVEEGIQTEKIKQAEKTTAEGEMTGLAAEEQATANQPMTTHSTDEKDTGNQIADRGNVSFQQGQSTYRINGTNLLITVELTEGGSYRYQFPIKNTAQAVERE